MNYYKRKRLEKGLTRSEAANYLGIDYKRYVLIERGNVKMPKNLINRFNEIINRGKGENQIDRVNREEKINKWWNDIINDKKVLKTKMEEFNIETYKELSKLLGYKSNCIISTYVNNLRKPSFDFKNKLYSFFENELNIQEPKIKKKLSTKKKINDEDFEYIEWYKAFNIKNWLEKQNLTIKAFAKYIETSQSVMWYYVNKKNYTPKIKTIEKVKNGIEKYEKECSNYIEEKELEITQKNDSDEILIPTFLVDMMEEQKEVTLQDKLINKYTNIVDNLEGQATDIIKEICELKTRLDDINKQKNIYGELLDDIKEKL